ncbi:type II toxin-antitoxin system RelE/ParE family toxin [Mesorhizobium sp. M0715]|uniref:type II toxin-antitoxin system RelE/ParE family toxin n=1 Tax=Mesorhizobium sp. M0715 TaxID=2956990 RepID=UPI00333B7469
MMQVSKPIHSNAGSKTSATRKQKPALFGIDRLTVGNPGDVKPVGEGISEMRIDDGPGYRIYFLQAGNLCVLLLCGGDKGTQSRDIAAAKKLAKEWKDKAIWQ